MKLDLVTLFNRLTQRELTDNSNFNAIVDNHYEKVKYFFHLITSDKDMCDHATFTGLWESNQCLNITVGFKKKAKLNDFQASFNRAILELDDTRSEHFKVKCEGRKNELNILIENKNVSTEDEIYGNRPDTI